MSIVRLFSYRNGAQSETEEEEETAQEKRLRLAKKYLQEIEEEGIKFKEKICLTHAILKRKRNSFV